MTAWLLLAALAAAQAPACAPLWVPPETYSAWSGLSRILEVRDEVRLTIALTPRMASRAKAALEPLVLAGRVELAARPEGDPWLPAVAYGRAPRPEDAIGRLAAARDALRVAFPSATVSGFAAPGGAYDERLAPSLKRLGFSWGAIGGGSGVDPTVSPAAVFVEPWQPGRPCGLSVIDEALGTSASADLATLLKETRGQWRTLSEAAASGAPAWAGSAVAWAASPLETPEAESAWRQYEAAAAAVRAFQNSGAGSVATLERAGAALRGAQGTALYRALADPAAAAAARKQLESRLQAAYKAIGARAPAGLLAEGVSGAVRLSSAPGSLRIDGGETLSTGSLRLRGMSVAWDDEGVTFGLRLDAPPPAEASVDVYIDLNGVPGAGRQALLPGRLGRLRSADAWELALSASPAAAALYRAASGGDPALLAEAKPRWDGRELSVRLPRSVLKGDPGRWGYAAAAFARPGSGPSSVIAGSEAGAADPGRLAAVRARPAYR